MDGKTALGASSPAKPALHSPDPLSQTRAVLSSSSHIFYSSVHWPSRQKTALWKQQGRIKSKPKTYSGSRATLALWKQPECARGGMALVWESQELQGYGREWASFWKRERFQACLPKGCVHQRLSREFQRRLPALRHGQRDQGAANVYLNLVTEIHGWGREIKENTGLTAAKTRIHLHWILHWIQHNFSCFSITLTKSWHMWITC